MAKRRCARCPVLVDVGAYRGLCDDCRRTWDAARGTREQRGYGAQHQAERQRIQDQMDQGDTFTCARCHQPITPGQAWHLDHNRNRTGYLGPSHEHCNNSAAGHASHTQ